MEVVQRDICSKPKICAFVADYINVFIRDNIQSSTQWCDPAIRLEMMDIGQAEYIWDLTLSDFPID